jgi:hypothetical protein
MIKAQRQKSRAGWARLAWREMVEQTIAQPRKRAVMPSAAWSGFLLVTLDLARRCDRIIEVVDGRIPG